MYSILEQIVKAPWDVRARTISCESDPGQIRAGYGRFEAFSGILEA